MTPTETDAVTAATAAPAGPAEGPGRRAGGLRFWASVALCCAALAASGGLRIWQERRVDAMLLEGRSSPFPLEQLPMELGPWRGAEAKLDPRIAAATGAVDHVSRRYVNQQTGTAVDVIVLYGPAAAVYIHAPEVCYPGSGFAQVEPTQVRRVDGVPFRSMVYAKGEGGLSTRQEVYYTWRYPDRWSPEPLKFKQTERIPGMYKVHLAREVMPSELRDVANPCEALLAQLMPEIERRIDEAQAAAPVPDAEAAPAR